VRKKQNALIYATCDGLKAKGQENLRRSTLKAADRAILMLMKSAEN
jgi:hypothetical protein